MMFQTLLVLVSVLSVAAFNPLGASTMSRIQMSAEKPSVQKVLGAALIASSMVSVPVFAKEGAGAKIGIFTNSDASSPFTDEAREDPLYSPYSPYGNGEKAAYNARKGSAEEVSFYKKQFDECVKRTEKIPSYAAKKTWTEITTELTRYTYNLRGAMLRLAEASKDPKAAMAAAKTYFSDINDIFEFASKKRGDIVMLAYEKSVADLAAFKATL